MKNMTHVGYDGTGGLTLDVVSTQKMPAAEVERWAESLASRAHFAAAQGFSHVQYDVTSRIPLTPEGARLLATDLNDRADEYEARPDVAMARIIEEGKN